MGTLVTIADGRQGLVVYRPPSIVYHVWQALKEGQTMPMLHRNLIDALRVVGLDVHQHPHHPTDDEWYCTSPLGQLGPFRSEEWALVEGVRALAQHASGIDSSATEMTPNPFERYLHDLEREQKELGE